MSTIGSESVGHRPIEQLRTVPLLELRGVTKNYVSDGGVEVEVLRGISLTIYAGEFLAIIGGSGSGKSTLLNVIGCLTRPTTGRYRVAGKNVNDLHSDDLAWLRLQTFGFVFQSYNLISSATALENVEIPAIYAGLTRHRRSQRALELLSELGLGERCGYRPSQLSGGQQQRVSIARALINGGRIILADEPTGALDSTSGAEVVALLQRLADQGHTIILVTHDKAIAARADRLVEIRDGRIVSDSGSTLDTRSIPASEFCIPDGDESTASALAEVNEGAKMALRALRANLFRTLLTLLGVFVGVASVIVMLAVTAGAERTVLADIAARGIDLLEVWPKVSSRSANPIRLSDAEAISQLPQVKAETPTLSTFVTAQAADIDYNTQARAMLPNFARLEHWQVAKGSFFTEEDNRSFAMVAVLGQTVVKNLFPGGGDPIGRYILINSMPFLVIGVMTERGILDGFFDDIIYVPLTTGQLHLFGGDPDLHTVVVQAASSNQIGITDKAVTALMRKRHQSDDFEVYNMTQEIKRSARTQDTLATLLGAIAAISLITGGIGVMNVMLMTVKERTREIGIRLATGARIRDILRQFLIEAVVVAALGGTLGVVVGIGTAVSLGAFMAVPIRLSTLAIAGALASALATGVVFGFVPALQAARLDPVAALAHE